MHATEGRSWRVALSADGARIDTLSGDTGAAGSSVRGTASDLVLAVYERIPLGSPQLAGDRHLIDQVRTREPAE